MKIMKYMPCILTRFSVAERNFVLTSDNFNQEPDKYHKLVYGLHQVGKLLASENDTPIRQNIIDIDGVVECIYKGTPAIMLMLEPHKGISVSSENVAKGLRRVIAEVLEYQLTPIVFTLSTDARSNPIDIPSLAAIR